MLRLGDVRLSENSSISSSEGPPPAKGVSRKRQRTSPLGRALRTVYDETLREDVPDDFMDLLKKLD